MINVAHLTGNHIARLFASLPEPEVATTWRPDELIDSWAESGGTITFPLASLADEGLTEAAADGITGDARQVAASLCNRIVNWYAGLTTVPDSVPTAKIQSRRTITTGDRTGEELVTYSFAFYVEPAVGSVTDEAA